MAIDVSKWEVVFKADYFRFVDHAAKVLSTGFETRKSLLRNADIIRVQGSDLIRMQDRYKEEYLICPHCHKQSDTRLYLGVCDSCNDSFNAR